MTLSESHALILTIVLCAVVLFGGYPLWKTGIRSFLKKRRYILARLEKADDAKEYGYWKQELRKNWQKRIPILGRKIREEEQY